MLNILNPCRLFIMGASGSGTTTLGRAIANEWAVPHADAPGIVVRCSSCGGVLLRLVETPTKFWLDVSGLSYLQIDRES